jgi:transcriptional antiterminator RfaH
MTQKTDEPGSSASGGAVADRSVFDGMPWYAMQTQARREAVAEAHLQRVCARVFCPRYRQRVILHGYRREVVRPLFPGYLFAAFDGARDFRAVHYAHGVRGVVTFGGESARVPPELLAGIEARMRDGFVMLQPARLQAGQRVEIVAGPFKGYTGVFEAEISSAERVAILLDTLRYSARAILDRSAVRALV